MKKTNRIKSNEDFTKVIKTGGFGKSDSFRVYWLNNNLGYTRIGIAASKKLGNAVIRSTTRRKIRAICDVLIDCQSCSLDIVVMPKEAFLNQTYEYNLSDLGNILSKVITIRTKK